MNPLSALDLDVCSLLMLAQLIHDESVGLSLIDRFTFHVLDFMEKYVSSSGETLISELVRYPSLVFLLLFAIYRHCQHHNNYVDT